jgi:putative sterol carrier protein
MADIAQLFEQMPGAFLAEKAGNLNATVQFNLTGDGGGQWNARVADGKCTIEKGTAANPTATINMAADDYADLISGKLNPVNAFMQGKVKVEGDLNTVMKFQTLFAR